MQNLAVPALWHQDNGGVTRERQGGSWRSRCLLPGLLRPSKRTSSNPTTASFHLLFLPLSSAFGLHLDVQLSAAFSSLSLLYCVACSRRAAQAPRHSTMRAAALRCSLPPAEATERTTKRTISAPSTTLVSGCLAPLTALPPQQNTAHIVSDGEYWPRWG
ncbi:hypothetical protein GGI35DRAFT_77865 [Trichoderma velutinum]